MADYKQLWDNALSNIHQSLNAMGKENEFNDWFSPIVFESFNKDTHRQLLEV